MIIISPPPAGSVTISTTSPALNPAANGLSVSATIKIGSGVKFSAEAGSLRANADGFDAQGSELTNGSGWPFKRARDDEPTDFDVKIKL